MANFFTAIFGTKNGRELKRMGKVVRRVNELEASFDEYTDLVAKTDELKSRLSGQRFGSDDEVIHAVENYLEAQDVTFFHEGIAKLEQIWTKYIEVKGDYVEK